MPTCEWLGPTILVCKNVLKNGTMNQIIEHTRKKGDDFWENNMIENEETGEEEIDTKYRCYQTGGESKLLNKIYEAIDEPVNECIQEYMKQFPHYSTILTSKEECSIIRYKKGGFQEEHVDVQPNDSDELDEEDEEDSIMISQLTARKLAVYIYINDDYEGGEINFPYQKISYKAEKGDVLIFDCGCLHPHSCEKVTKGKKYVITTWMF